MRRIKLRSPLHVALRVAAAWAASACEVRSGFGPRKRMCTKVSMTPSVSPSLSRIASHALHAATVG